MENINRFLAHTYKYVAKITFIYICVVGSVKIARAG